MEDSNQPSRTPPPARPVSARPPAVHPPAAAGPAPADPGGNEGDARPTPVRAAVGAPPAAREVEPPSRRAFTHDGLDWIAETAGAALSGAAGDAAAVVILVLFRKEENESPVKEALIPRHSLDDLSDLELLEAFEGAVPFRKPEVRPGVFQSTRKAGTPQR